MLSSRIKNRIDSFQYYSIGYIKEYSLEFHKLSIDTSGKANGFFTGDKKDLIWGVIGEIKDEDKVILDKIEGLGKGYNQETVRINLEDNTTLDANIYLADTKYIKDDLLPFNWYKEFVLRGAMENNLPNEYIENIKLMKSQKDKNSERSKKNFDIV